MDRNTRRLGGGRACLCQVGALLALVGIVVVVVYGRVASVSWAGSSHFFSRDAEDAVQAQPKNVPKLLSFTFKVPEVVA